MQWMNTTAMMDLVCVYTTHMYACETKQSYGKWPKQNFIEPKLTCPEQSPACISLIQQHIHAGLSGPTMTVFFSCNKVKQRSSPKSL